MTRLGNLWRKVVEAIETIQPFYERMNVIMSLGLGRAARIVGVAAAQEACNTPQTIVDIGVGPGVSSKLLLNTLAPSYLVAVDPSPRLAASALAELRSPQVDVVAAVGEALPLRSNCCGLAAAFYSLRDFTRPWRGLKEMLRVAKCVLVVDVFRPRNPLARSLLELWVCRIIPVLAMVVARPVWRSYRLFCQTLRGWIPVEALANALASRGMAAVWSKAGGSIAVVLGVKS